MPPIKPKSVPRPIMEKIRMSTPHFVCATGLAFSLIAKTKTSMELIRHHAPKAKYRVNPHPTALAA